MEANDKPGDISLVTLNSTDRSLGQKGIESLCSMLLLLFTCTEHILIMLFIVHYTEHTCTIMLFLQSIQYDPLVKHWTMHFEAKHNHFKKLAQYIRNFIHISWTLACRHQYWQCYK